VIYVPAIIYPTRISCWSTDDFVCGGILTVSLENCVDRVEQHWAYEGKAPGNGGNGNIYFAAGFDDNGYNNDPTLVFSSRVYFRRIDLEFIDTIIFLFFRK